MDPAQCQLELGLEYHSAMRNYESAVHQALSRANLLRSEEIATLQAAVLYLLCARVDGNTRIVWAETAVVIRLAEAQGIHRDGTNSRLSPFETEIRRRLWWHICILDMLCSEDQAVQMQITSGMFDTEFPINVNGDELEPNMPELPPEKEGFTDITLCIISCFMIAEVQLSPQPFNPVASLKDREDRIKAVGGILHEGYLNHFNLEIPIHWVTATIARLSLSKAWVSVHSQLSPADLDEAQSEQKDSVFRTAVELVEFTHFLQSNHVTTQLAWLCRSYKQKEVIAFILSELSVRPPGPETDRAWEAVTKTTSLWRQRPSSTGGVPEKPLIELIQGADLLREAKLGSHPVIQMDLSAGDPLGREKVTPDPPLEPCNGNVIPGQISLDSEFSGSYRKPSTLAWLQGIWPYQNINELL